MTIEVLKTTINRGRPYIAFLLFCCLLLRVIYFYLSPDQSLITAIPDDAFYYLQLAKYQYEIGFWTFDGKTPATGFHLLYGYLLYFIYLAFPTLDWHTLFLIISVAASAAISISAYLTSITAEATFNKAVSLAAFAPFFSQPIFFQSTAMMESWLVILIASYSLYLISNNKPTSSYCNIGLVILGALGSCARSDYGLLPGVFFLSYGFYSRFDIKLDRYFYRSFFLLSGAVIGVLVVFIHNLFLSGELLQASAQIKSYWSFIEGNKISNSLALLSDIAFPFFNKKPFLYLLLLAIYPIGRSFALSNKTNIQSKLTFHASLITILGYVLFYKYNSAGLQNWYSANLLIPLALGFSGLIFYACKTYQKISSLILWLVFTAFSIGALTIQPWPHQSQMLQAGLYLKDHHEDANYAAWNAGIISYFSKLPIINIDGLTNDEIVPYIKSNTTFDYLQKANIGFIVDYEIMFIDGYRRRGGYLDKRIDECITPIHTVEEDKVGMGESKIKIFKITARCGGRAT